MKRVVASSVSEETSDTRTVEDIPDISNRFLSVDAVVSWLDKLVEVGKDDENIRN